MNDKKVQSANSLKSRSGVFRKSPSGFSASGHLFLGHKLLDELRILMRLSAAMNGNTDHGFGGNHEQAS